MHSYEDIPLEHCEYGQDLYETGRELVEHSGVRLAELVWDADEVLWDWLMDGSQMLRGVAGALLRRDFGHREFYLVKPGVFELIWGMHHASVELGLDPHMRIWTNGYPWRLWRASREIPGFDTLVGPPAEPDAVDHGAFIDHPRIFYRTDYAEVVHCLLEPDGFARQCAAFPEHVRALISSQLSVAPFDSTFKLPELAQVCGKDGFDRARVLVDDAGHNVRRFVASGRHGIHVVSHAPRIIFGTVPNTVWSEPRDALRGLANEIAPEIAQALRSLTEHSEPARVAVASDTRVRQYTPMAFEFDVPDERIRTEWIDPIQELKRTWA